MGATTSLPSKEELDIIQMEKEMAEKRAEEKRLADEAEMARLEAIRLQSIVDLKASVDNTGNIFGTAVRNYLGFRTELEYIVGFAGFVGISYIALPAMLRMSDLKDHLRWLGNIKKDPHRKHEIADFLNHWKINSEQGIPALKERVRIRGLIGVACTVAYVAAVAYRPVTKYWNNRNKPKQFY